MTYRIKPLVWVPWELGNFRAESVFGFYEIWSVGFWRAPAHLRGIWSDNPKSAAQLDYEARIRSALEPADPLADAMKLPKIKALVAADNAIDDEYSSQEYGPTIYNIENLRTALAVLTKEGE